MIETLVALLVLAVVVGLAVALVAVLVRRITGGSAEVAVQEEIAVSGAASQHDAALAAGLRAVRGARFHQLGPGRYVITVNRSPNWTLWFLPLFGLGFVLSLLFLQQWLLTITLYDAEGGARVRLEGRTETRILDRVRDAVTY